MIDHLGLGVRDGQASRRFYTEALKPLGIGVVMEFGDSVGMGTEGKAFFWFHPGGELVPLSDADWNLILPYLQENEKLFDISIERDLLTVDGALRPPAEVYRKVHPVKLAVLTQVEDDWE